MKLQEKLDALKKDFEAKAPKQYIALQMICVIQALLKAQLKSVIRPLLFFCRMAAVKK